MKIVQVDDRYFRILATLFVVAFSLCPTGSASDPILFAMPITLPLLCLLFGWLGRGFGNGRDEDWRLFVRELPLYSLALIALWVPVLDCLLACHYICRLVPGLAGCQLLVASTLAILLARTLAGRPPLWLISMWLFLFALWHVKEIPALVCIDLLLLGCFAATTLTQRICVGMYAGILAFIWLMTWSIHSPRAF
jgi:hypothetical protein